MIGPIILNYTDFPDAATTSNYDFAKSFKGINGAGKQTIIKGVVAKVLTPFAGAGPVSAATLSLGSVAAPTQNMTAKNVMAAANTLYTSALLTADAAATQLRAQLLLTGGNASGLTAGRVALWLDVDTLPVAN